MKTVAAALGCYDPRQPNSYFEAVRRRRQNDGQPPPPPPPPTTTATTTTTTTTVSSSDASLLPFAPPSGAVLALASQLITNSTPTADDVLRYRLEMSTSLGVAGAQEQLDEHRRVSLLERRAAGATAGARGKKLLGMMGHVDGKAIGDGGLLKPLEMKSSGAMGGGVHRVVGVTTTSASDERSDHFSKSAGDDQSRAKPPIQGKMSATILLRNVVPSSSSSSSSTSSTFPSPPTKLAIDQLTASLTKECASYGVVRAVRVVVHHDDGDDVLSSTQQQSLTTGDGANAVAAASPCFSLRCFVKFDCAASAFRAADSMHWQLLRGRRVVVSYFPTALFDRNEFAAAGV